MDEEEAGEAAMWNRNTSANHTPLAHTAANWLSCMQNQCRATRSTAGTHCSPMCSRGCRYRKQIQYQCWNHYNINVNTYWCLSKPLQLSMWSFNCYLGPLIVITTDSIDPPRAATCFHPIFSRPSPLWGFHYPTFGWLSDEDGRWCPHPPLAGKIL